MGLLRQKLVHSKRLGHVIFKKVNLNLSRKTTFEAWFSNARSSFQIIIVPEQFVGRNRMLLPPLLSFQNQQDHVMLQERS